MTATAQERLDALLETEWVPNQTNWTLNQIVLHTQSTDLAGKIEVSLTAMSQLGVPFSQSSLIALATAGGLPLWQSHAQDLIDFLAAQSQVLPEPLRWDTQFVMAIKALGGRNRPIWEKLGRPTAPTLEQIESEIAAEEAQAVINAFNARVTNACALFRERMTSESDAGEVMTQAWSEAV